MGISKSRYCSDPIISYRAVDLFIALRVRQDVELNEESAACNVFCSASAAVIDRALNTSDSGLSKISKAEGEKIEGFINRCFSFNIWRIQHTINFGEVFQEHGVLGLEKGIKG